MLTDDFWIQPAKGFTDRSRGRTEEEIARIEAGIGFRLPSLYRDLMKIQNGGYLRRRAYPYADGVRELFYNGAVLDPIFEGSVVTVLQDLGEFMEEEELEQLSPTEFNYLDRLVIASTMYGHSYMCFDYGWQQEAVRAEPEVCFFDLEGDNGFEEYLRVESFEKLVSRLVYYGYESTSFYVGVTSSLPLEALVPVLGNQWGVEFEANTTDRYGWFNFDRWFSGDLPLTPKLSLHIVVSPNQHRSGTYLFQNHTDKAFVIELVPVYQDDTSENNPAEPIWAINTLVRSLNSKDASATLLLAPFVQS